MVSSRGYRVLSKLQRASNDMYVYQGCIQKCFQRGANLGYGQKRGGGSLCGVLHPTLARGGENDTRGVKCPSPPPLKYSPVYGMELLASLQPWAWQPYAYYQHGHGMLHESTDQLWRIHPLVMAHVMGRQLQTVIT